MKLSEQLQQDHDCGDFGNALDGYAERARKMEAALEKIANPVFVLSQEAEEQGAAIDGMAAVALSENAPWLRDIAQKAIQNT